MSFYIPLDYSGWCVSVFPSRLSFLVWGFSLFWCLLFLHSPYVVLFDVPDTSLCLPGSSFCSFFHCTIFLGVPIATFFVYRRQFGSLCLCFGLLSVDRSTRSCPVLLLLLAQCTTCPVSFCVSGLLCWAFSHWYGLPSFSLRLGFLWEVCWGCLSSQGGQVRVYVYAVLCSVLFTIMWILSGLLGSTGFFWVDWVFLFIEVLPSRYFLCLPIWMVSYYPGDISPVLKSRLTIYRKTLFIT